MINSLCRVPLWARISHQRISQETWYNTPYMFISILAYVGSFLSNSHAWEYMQFTKESGIVVDEVKLKVVYVPPSSQTEGSEDGSPGSLSYQVVSL
jgi:hypothetical protein